MFQDIGELLTLEGAQHKGARSVSETDLSLLTQAVIICDQGKIVWIGPQSAFKASLLQAWGGEKQAEFISLNGRTVLPAFVEPHTHLIFAGDRAHEFEWRIQGQTYQEISAKGGGIRFTVSETRQASADTLLRLAQQRCDRFYRQGVTTLEVKSGYGLDMNTELRSLQVARALKGPRIVTTYLGAHSRSPDFPDLDSYINMMCDEVLPRLARDKMADRVDMYIEDGFFTSHHARKYFQRARDLGLAVTGHCEQLSDSGGADVLLEFAAQSVDHVVFINPQTLERVAKSHTTAVLLPTSDFYLRVEYPKARALIGAGARVALSTDFNPGTSPTQDLSLVGVLARLEMKMTLPEVITAYTLGAAFALGKQNQVGSVTVGKDCDFVVLSGSWSELFYSVGEHPIARVYQAGEQVVNNDSTIKT